MGALLSLVDGKQQITSWRYDEYGQVTNKLDANGAESFRCRYDVAGRMTNCWTPAKGDTYYVYDALANLTAVRYPSQTNTYSYDSLNRLTNVTDALGATAFSWTDGNQLASENGPWAADLVTYTYDNRKRSSLSLQQPNGSVWTQEYHYDDYGRLAKTISGAGPFEYGYTAEGLGLVSWVRRKDQSGAYDWRTYDDLGRMTYIGNGYVDRWYSYDHAFRRTQQVFTAGNFINYTYDKIGQLKSAKGWESDGATPRLHEQFGYGYDAAWNLSSRTNNALVQTFAVNNLNELSSAGRGGSLTVAGQVGQGTAPFSVTVSGTGLSSGAASVYGDGAWARPGATLADGPNSWTATATDTAQHSSQHTVTASFPASVTYQYDGNGNLTNDGLRRFEYDWENQLTNVYVPNQWRSEFVYDGFMRRRIRKEYTWSGSGWLKTNEVRYVYAICLAVQERDSNNLPTVTYTRGLDVGGSLEGAGGVGGLLARTAYASGSSGSSEGTHAFYQSDALGNVIGMQNEDNVLVASYSYDPFGNTLSANGPLADLNVYRFSSKEWHEKSGCYYYLYRFYEPKLQRWINRDPLGNYGAARLALGTYSRRHSRYPIQLLGTVAPFSLSTVYPSPWMARPFEFWGDHNLYGFCGNDPIDFCDFLGLSFWGRLGNGIEGGLAGLGTGILTGMGVGSLVGTPGVGTAAGGIIGGITGAIGGFIAGALVGGPDYNPTPAGIAGGVTGVVVGGLAATCAEFYVPPDFIPRPPYVPGPGPTPPGLYPPGETGPMSGGTLGIE